MSNDQAFVEIDLVAHDGGLAAGDYCQSLDLTDIATTWTETLAVRNLRVFAISFLEHEAARRDDRFSAPVMHHLRGEHGNAGVPMLLFVPARRGAGSDSW